MHVAYLTNQYPKVSHTFIRREILALEQQGIEVSRYSLRGWDADTPDPQDQAEKHKTQYTLSGGILPLLMCLLICAFRFPRLFWSSLAATLVMARNSVRSWPYHLIYLAHASRIRLWLEKTTVSHLHAHFGTNPAEIAMLVHLMGGPEYSFTVHGMDEADNAARLGFEHKVARAKFVAAISAYTRSQLMRHVSPEHWSKIKIIHCGLPDNAFGRFEDFAPAPTQRFLCVGRLSAEKGHRILLDAFAFLRKDYPNLELVLAGGGEMRTEIEDRISALKLDNSVRVTGWLSSDEVYTEIKKCHVLVQPSFIEGLPVVIMEAMAQSRPVISTYVGGIPELVQPGISGWLVPAGDTESLAGAMRAALLSSAEDLRKMGRAARKRASNRHNIEVEAKKLSTLFNLVD
ncbi:MAG: glycosyltransferase family 4 protein [Hyphomicrobiales bacterium]